MGSVGRKFLLAGRGGLNLTHSEPLDPFLARYGPDAAALRPALEAFGPEALRAWCEGLGQSTFVGSSGRVFPVALKASPLLRAWLSRLAGLGVEFRLRHRWSGWREGALVFSTPSGEALARPAATLLALGGASWARLGSDGAWADVLRARGVSVTPLRSANAGVLHAWSDFFRARFEGAPLKRIALTLGDTTVRGEAVITADGLEGGAVYALSRAVRTALDRDGTATLLLDLRPDLDDAALRQRMAGGGQSRANALRRAGFAPIALSLQRELGDDPKRLPLAVSGLTLLDRAISTAGGVALGGVDERSMLRALPGVFAAGEMLDWDAPTGGYLLQACFSTGWQAAGGMLDQIAHSGQQGLSAS